jgi:hypothetical protein
MEMYYILFSHQVLSDFGRDSRSRHSAGSHLPLRSLPVCHVLWRISHVRVRNEVLVQHEERGGHQKVVVESAASAAVHWNAYRVLPLRDAYAHLHGQGWEHHDIHVTGKGTSTVIIVVYS